MLLQFSVSNFRSFKDEQFITMIPAKIKGHEENIAHVAPGLDVLKSAVIYGANASGKSNFVKALECFTNIITTSSKKNPGEIFDEYEPYKLSEDNLTRPIAFSIEVESYGVRYHYEFSFDKQKIVSESLSFFPLGRESKLFEREQQSFKFGENLKGPKKLLQQITAPNQLLLSKGVNNNVNELIKLYFILGTILPIPPFEGDFEIESKIYAHHFFTDKSYAKTAQRSINLLRFLDTGILDIKIEDLTPNVIVNNNNSTKEKAAQIRSKNYRILTKHLFEDNEKNNEIWFDMKEESSGTKKLFFLAGFILYYLEVSGGIMILDEFDRSLHPHLSQFLINLFNNPKINKKNAQLIVSTHNASLLSEENKLRRDQIWIVEKNEQGASQMISLADMKGIRDNVPFEKWYLSGRFGGVPNIESLQFEYDFADDEKTENNSNGAH